MKLSITTTKNKRCTYLDIYIKNRVYGVAGDGYSYQMQEDILEDHYYL